MKIARRFFVFFAASCLALPALANDPRATPEEAKAMLDKAVAHVKAVGPDKAAAV